MNNLSAYKYKNQIILYAMVVFIIFEIISLIFLRFNVQFLYGLLLGTAIAIVNFNLLYLTSLLVCKIGHSGFFVSFMAAILRLFIFGFVFFAALKVSNLAAFAAAIGFLTIKIGIYYCNLRQRLQKRTIKTK